MTAVLERPSKVTQLADATPEDRERSVDLARAVAIVAVVLGHWLAADVGVEDGRIVGGNALGDVSLLRWLTWVFQVMPVFFVATGYANAASWTSARRRGSSWADWMRGRLLRLWAPLRWFTGVGMALSGAGIVLGFGADVSRAAHLAVIQLWFLPVFLVVAAITPLAVDAAHRWGWTAPAVLGGAVVLLDLAGTGAGQVGWLNIVVVWTTVALVGVGWQVLGAPAPALGRRMAVVCFVVAALLAAGPYPETMVGVPGAVRSNAEPPNLVMLAFGVGQAGLLFALRPALERLLRRPRVWLAVVLVNARAMTLYLWHLVAAVGAAVLLAAGGALPALDPGCGTWWLYRLPWVLTALVVLAVLVIAVGRFERAPDPTMPPATGGRVALATLLFAAATLRLTLVGFAPSDVAFGVDLLVPACLVTGALLARLRPFWPSYYVTGRVVRRPERRRVLRRRRGGGGARRRRRR